MPPSGMPGFPGREGCENVGDNDVLGKVCVCVLGGG